jgi:hypothetical protein
MPRRGSGAPTLEHVVIRLLALVWLLVAGPSAARTDAVLSDRAPGALCEAAEAADCDVTYSAIGDHYYVYPAAPSVWGRSCRNPDIPGDFGIPAALARDLLELEKGDLQDWVAAGGALDREFIRTITFCGFAVTDILDLDWSATNARIRFYLTTLRREHGISASQDPEAEDIEQPHGIFPSRGIFSSGLTIDRSVLPDGTGIDDARFGAFVEIERSLILQPLSARNTTVAGALRLRNNEFADRLRLEAFEVAGDTIVSGNSFPAAIPGPRVERDGTAASIVRLRELRLRGVLHFSNNRFRRPPDLHRPIVSDNSSIVSRSLYLQKSIIDENDITIVDNYFHDHVYLIDLIGRRLSISNNVVNGILQISGNDFFSLRTFSNVFYSFFQIMNNQYASSLIIDRDEFGANTRRIDIVGNHVGQDMRFAPRVPPPQGSTVSLAHNRVVGPADLYWPSRAMRGDPVRNDRRCEVLLPQAGDAAADSSLVRWRGMIDFTGSHFASHLQFAESCESAGIPMQPIPLQYDLADLQKWQNEPKCSGRRELGMVDESYFVFLNFSQTRIAMLDLRVPPTDCHYFWRAVGQQFEFFGTNAEDQIAQIQNGESIQQFGYTQRTAIDLLKAWILNLDIDDPGVFIFISEYLKDRGDLNGSRNWLEVAKRETYKPNGEDPLWRRAADRVVYGALWPAGFGAKPERAIWFMFVLWIVCTAVYTLHHRGWINAAATFLHLLRDPLPSGLVYHQPGGAAGSGPGLGESPRAGPPAPSIFVEPGQVIRAAATGRQGRCRRSSDNPSAGASWRGMSATRRRCSASSW